jgi:hypothetical protein
MCRFRPLVLATAALVGGLLTPAPAGAHAFHADVTVADAVTVLAYFGGDEPADDAAVTVTDAAGAVVAAGKTDDRGLWTFPKPGPGTYLVTVRSIGHVAKREFTVEEAPGAGPVVFTGWRPNQTAGLAAGLVLLLGASAISWFLSRRRRVR